MWFRRSPLPRYWNGSISGTNRGEAIARLRIETGDRVVGRAVIFDRAYGPTSVRLVETLTNGQLNLKMYGFKGFSGGLPGIGVPLPVSGSVSLTLAPDQKTLSGQWGTDLGACGSCTLEAARVGLLRHSANLCVAAAYSGARRTYLFLLLAAIVLNGRLGFEISTPVLALLLAPAVYLFKYEIKELLQLFGVRRIGPLDFQQASPEGGLTVGAGAGPVPSAAPTAIPIPPPMSDAANFVILDNFFVVRTKLILLWLYERASVDSAEFAAYAGQIGVPTENMSQTLGALIQFRCVETEGPRFRLTAFGRQYAERLGAKSKDTTA
jgi:hypothetical protein